MSNFILESFEDFRNDLFIDLPKMEFVTIPIDEFLQIPTIRNNREVNARKARIAKILRKKAMLEHLKVIIAEYPDGSREIMNGNTRKAIWIEGLSEKPDYVIAQITYYRNRKEARKEYYAIDSQDSVENASDKFTGAFRILNMTLRSKKLKKGALTNPVKDFLAVWPNGDIPKSPKGENNFFILATKLLRNEIIELDSILESLNRPDRKSMSQANFMTVSLLFLKKYGTNNERLKEGIRKLFSGYMSWPEDGRNTDGISHINFELRNDLSTWLPKGATRTGTREQYDFIISCFQKWMDNSNMSNARRYQRENSPYINFFEGFDVSDQIVARRLEDGTIEMM